MADNIEGGRLSENSNTVVHLGKFAESGFTYYDQRHDAWCDYFLREDDAMTKIQFILKPDAVAVLDIHIKAGYENEITDWRYL